MAHQGNQMINGHLENRNRFEVVNSGQYAVALQESQPLFALPSSSPATLQNGVNVVNEAQENPKSKRKNRGKSKSYRRKNKTLHAGDKESITEPVPRSVPHIIADQSRDSQYPNISLIEDSSSTPVYHIKPAGSVEPQTAILSAGEIIRGRYCHLPSPKIELTEILEDVSKRFLDPQLDLALDDYLHYMPKNEYGSVKQEPAQNASYDPVRDAYPNIKQEYTPYEEEILSTYFRPMVIKDVDEFLNMDFIQELNDKSRNSKK